MKILIIPLLNEGLPGIKVRISTLPPYNCLIQLMFTAVSPSNGGVSGTFGNHSKRKGPSVAPLSFLQLSLCARFNNPTTSGPCSLAHFA